MMYTKEEMIDRKLFKFFLLSCPNQHCCHVLLDQHGEESVQTKKISQLDDVKEAEHKLQFVMGEIERNEDIKWMLSILFWKKKQYLFVYFRVINLRGNNLGDNFHAIYLM